MQKINYTIQSCHHHEKPEGFCGDPGLFFWVATPFGFAMIRKKKDNRAAYFCKNP
jgi:hypothetical protein